VASVGVDLELAESMERVSTVRATRLTDRWLGDYEAVAKEAYFK
jgi:hypothetical protein